MSSTNTGSSRKRGAYSLKKDEGINFEEGVTHERRNNKYRRGAYRGESGDSEEKVKRGPYRGKGTLLLAKQQGTTGYCECYQNSDTFSDLDATTCGTIEEVQSDCDTPSALRVCLPENTDTADSDQNSTGSESVIDFDLDSCSDSDFDEDCNDSEKNESLLNKSCGVVSPPLYQLPPSSSVYTAPITQTEHLTMIISYALKHCLTYQAFQDLLRLISLHCPQPNLCELSVLKAKASLVAIEDKIIYLDYCESCFLLFGETEVVCQNCIKEENGGTIRFRYQGSREDQKLKRRKCFFMSVPFEDQLKTIFEKEEVWNHVVNKLTRQHPTKICDIIDGSSYKEHCKPGGFLHNPNNFSLVFNTDGVPIFKSSGVGVWPIYLAINELPKCQRFSKKNLVVWGLWQGRTKPAMSTFLTPFLSCAQSLRKQGIGVTTSSGAVVQAKGAVLVSSMDLQAKALNVNMHQHNGECGCSTCEARGQHVRSGKGWARHYACNPNEKQRTHQSILENASQAITMGKHVKGILGFSPFIILDELFDLALGFPPDYMHGVLLGVTKDLLSLWFGAKNKDEDYFIGHLIGEVDSRLLKMRPPDFISRLPRSLNSNRNHMKASELRSWLLFYALPCLDGILPDIYLEHFALLVEGIHILLGESISQSDLMMAEQYLTLFYAQYAPLYGEGRCRINHHNLMHLAKFVKCWGPLWAWSCFGFEGMNGSLTKFIHGTGMIGKQVLWSICIQRQLSFEVSKCMASTQDHSDVTDFVIKMVSSKRQAFKVTVTVTNCGIGGKLTTFEPNAKLKEVFKKSGVSLDSDVPVEKFGRAVVADMAYFSREYTRMAKRNCTVVYFDGKFGIIQYFVLLRQVGYACITELKVIRSPLPTYCTRLYAVEIPRGEPVTTVVEVSEILDKCVILEGNERQTYVSLMPNYVERD